MNQRIFTIFLCVKIIQSLSNAELFLLPDSQLFQLGIDQFRLGNVNSLGNDFSRCMILDDPHACSHYAKVCYPDGTCEGLPDLYGSGCLVGCWGPPNTYQDYQTSKIPICTGNMITDGANMMRIGIIKGFCGNLNTNTSSANSVPSTTTGNSTNTSQSQSQKSTVEGELSKKGATQSGIAQWLFWLGIIYQVSELAYSQIIVYGYPTYAH